MSTAPSQLNNFLRAWNISIATQAGKTYTLASGSDETLRVQFEIETVMLMVFWTCTLTIFNMSNQAATSIMAGAPSSSTTNLWDFGKPIVSGDTVTISAGYQYGSSGAFQAISNVLYTGKVLQAIWMRENVVNSKLILRCITGLTENTLNFESSSLGKGATDYTTLQRITKNSQLRLDIDPAVQSLLGNSKYPSSQILYGRPYDLIGGILKQHGLQGWVTGGTPNSGSSNSTQPTLTVRNFGSSVFPTPAFVYGAPQVPGGVGPPASTNIPSSGTNSANTRWTLIGVPEQTQFGIVFRVLMDSAPQIGDIVQLAPGTLVNPYLIQYPNNHPAIPNQTGSFSIIGLRYFGDSRGRGNDWYTEITGLTQDFFSQLGKASPNANANTSSSNG